jgi:hypothetical protein
MFLSHVGLSEPKQALESRGKHPESGGKLSVGKPDCEAATETRTIAL